MRRLMLVVPLAALALATGACSSGGTSASSSPSAAAASSTGSSVTGSPASGRSPLCDSMEALRASAQQLKDVDVGRTGVQGIQTALQAVQADLKQVVADAKTHVGSLTDQLQADATALRTAVSAAQATPNVSTLGDVRTAIRTFADEVQRLAAQVKPSC